MCRSWRKEKAVHPVQGNDDPVSGGISELARRGATGFGAGSVIALLVIFLSPNRFPWNLILQLIAFVISGAIGGASLAWGRKSRHATLLAAIGFGIGFSVLGFVVPYPLALLQEPAREISGFRIFFVLLFFFALVYGLGFYIAGVIGAAFMRSGLRFALFGGEAFAIGGVIGSVLFVIPFFFLGHLWPFMKVVWSCIGILVAYSIGGAYLGASVGSLKKKNSGIGDS
jgi:hypothetical protein